MSPVAAIGTYLPPWRDGKARVEGPDEDALTLAVAAGRQAVSGDVTRVVLVTRGLPLLEGGNAAPLLGGLGLDAGTEVVEQVGGATATLDALLAADAGTLVIGVDVGPGAGAAAAWCGRDGRGLSAAYRTNRSLPVQTRDLAGNAWDYGDPRLSRERGLAVSLQRAGGPKPTAVAGVGAKEARALCAGDPPALPTTGASAPIFALALLDAGDVLAAADQATVSAAVLDGTAPAVVRDERDARDLPRGTHTPGPPIPISIPAYDRAFDAKLRWQASTNRDTGALDLPPRVHDAVRGGDGDVLLTPLSRRGEVYTTTTVHVPVPGKATPYQLVIVELEDGVRALVATTGSLAGEVSIGDRGDLVLRRVEVRSGVPDYGYAFRPDGRGEPEPGTVDTQVGEVPA